MEDESWCDENQKRLDLSLENDNLETELLLKTGAEIQQSEKCDPVIHNQFLKNVLAFEEADKEPEIPMRSLFPEDFEFPHEETMSDEQIEQKLNDIYTILAAHNIKFGFSEALPDRVLYNHLVKECISTDTVHPSASIGFTCVLDGCNGNCPDCFQKEYCETGRNYEKSADDEM